jgi:hypothetical protein
MIFGTRHATGGVNFELTPAQMREVQQPQEVS